MPKSELATLLVLVLAAGVGYLAVDRNAANQVLSWLRQEIRKEVPDARPLGHPNYTPVLPTTGS